MLTYNNEAPLITLASQTDMRLAFNEQHQLFMREFGLDKVDVSAFNELYDHMFDVLNINDDDTVLDAGAYIGRSARYFFSRHCKHVVSIEAYANNVHILELNAGDPRMLLKHNSEQVHTVFGGALWQTNSDNSGRVYLNSNSKSRAAMTTYRLQHSQHIAWTNAVSMLSVFQAFKPDVGVFTINGTEFDMFNNLVMLESLKVFREIFIEFNMRTREHIKSFKWYDKYIREVLLYDHIIEPDLSVIKTQRKENFLIKLPVLYIKKRTNVLVGPREFETNPHDLFKTGDDIIKRNKAVVEAQKEINKWQYSRED